MAKFNALTPSEKIVAFLDGELPESETNELFKELSQDPDLQEEMRQHTLLRGWMPKVLPPPPAYLKKRIAGNLGFTNVFKSFRYALFALFFVTLAGSAVYMSVYRGDGGPAKPTHSKMARVPAAPQSSVPGSYSREDSPVVAVRAHHTMRNVAGTTEYRPNEAPAAVITDATAPVKTPERVSSNMIDLSLAAVSSPAMNKRKLYPYPIYGKNEQALESLSSLYFGFRKISAISLPRLDIEAPASSLLGDYALELGYALKNGDAFGLETGNETITQMFSGKVKGSKAIYKQVYRGFWGAAFYRFSLPAMINGALQPNISLGAGYYEMGPLARGSAGMDYNLTENLIISLRAETSMFFYSYDRTPYVTVKPGISYGLKFRM